jgi:hypothetical protein
VGSAGKESEKASIIGSRKGDDDARKLKAEGMVSAMMRICP